MASTPGSSTQLQSLLDKASEAGPDNYNELLTLVSIRLFRLTRKMLRSYPHLRRWEQTDDVFQNALLRLHRSLKEVKPRSVREFFGLATLQIRRTLIDLARHHYGPEGYAAKHESDDGREDSGRFQQKVAANDRPESLEAWTSFHEAVERLPADEREVFQLLWYGGMEQKQVATLVGVSLPTVERRWYRARHAIHTALSGQQPSFGE